MKTFRHTIQLLTVTALSVGLLVGLLASTVWGSATTTFTVNSTADAVDTNPGDGVCATSAGVCTLRAAVQETNALTGDDIITLPAGTYAVTIDGEAEEDAATGDLDIHDNLVINGNSANSTIIDGNALDRVFDIRSAYNVTFSNITIQNGQANDTSIFHFGGGAIRGGGNLSLNSVALKNNTAVNGNGGGAILIFGSATGTTLTIANSTLSGNTAAGSGGAISHNLARANTHIIIENSTLSDNSGHHGGAIASSQGDINLKNAQLIGNLTGFSGGALYLYSGNSRIEITDTLFRQNSAGYGGGIYSAGENNLLIITNTNFISNTTISELGGALYMTGLTNTLSIANSTFSQNSSESNGGAIGLYGPGSTYETIGVSAIISGSSFIENNARFGGGALYQSEGTSVSVNGSAFIGNTADNGGAIHGTSDGVTGQATGYITNSTFSGNSVTGSGGAIYGQSPSTHLYFRNATIAFNTADSDNNGGNGGGVNSFSGAIFEVTNSLIANNNGNLGPDCYANSGFTSVANNLVGKTDGCTFTPGSNDLVGSIASPLDPKLQPLTNSPAYHPLYINSPAVDAGFPADCPTIDQAGSIRPIDGNMDGSAICDIGAIEAPERVSVTMDPSIEATLVYSDTQGNPTTIQIPVGAVTETTTLIYAHTPTVTPPSGFVFASHAFDINAYRNEVALPGFAFESPITLTISYSDADVAGLDESNLTLLYWNGNQWDAAACGSYVHEVDINRLTAPICHLSRFALFGEGQSVFLPLIMR